MRLLASIVAIILTTCNPSYGASMLEKAAPYVTVIEQVYSSYWNDAPLKFIVYGQIEQESSWNVRAHLHTAREDGYGLGQITVTPRFNNFKTAISFSALKGWDWQNDKYNPKNQITFMVLQDRSNFKQVTKYFINDEERTKGMLVSYNAGLGRVLKRRQAAITKGYKHDTWTNGLEDVHDRFEDKSLYGRPLYKAVNEYPIVVFKKSQKYINIMK